MEEVRKGREGGRKNDKKITWKQRKESSMMTKKR